MAMATGSVKTGCSAFDDLNEHLSQSYVSYGKLCQDEELGKHPDMYESNLDCNNEMKPADHTSDYLRGGVISTMAAFEEFVGDLINEATDLVAKKYKHENGCQNQARCSLKRRNARMCKRYSQPADQRKRLTHKDVTLHKWATYDSREDTTAERPYLEYLLLNEEEDSFIDIILKQGDFSFIYKISAHKMSRITISANPNAKQQQISKCFICVMLRFCYGIRNVMAHGNADRTFNRDGGTLTNFTDKCDECNCQECRTCECFEDTVTLVKFYNHYITQLNNKEEKKDAESKVRCIPNRYDFRLFYYQYRAAHGQDDTESSYESYNSRDEESENEVPLSPGNDENENYFDDTESSANSNNDDSNDTNSKAQSDASEDLNFEDPQEQKHELNWEKCFDIIDSYFKNSDKDPLPASYAYFHMIRVYYWLEESRRGMFVTYRLFERITQFIHTLSFRMYLAVAELLIDNYGLPDGVWGVEKQMIGTMIRHFQNQSVATTYMFKYAFLWCIIIRFACL